MFLAGLVDDTNGFVCGCNRLHGCVVDASVADHILFIIHIRSAGGGEGGTYRRRKVVHDEFEFALTETLGHFVRDLEGAHWGFQIVRSNTGRRNHVSDFVLELFLDTAVEEEGYVCVFLRLGDVALLDLLLCEPFGKDVVHALRREGDVEGVLSLVLCHCCDVEVLGKLEVCVGEVGGVDAEEERDFADAVGSVVEEEEGVVVYDSCQ